MKESMNLWRSHCPGADGRFLLYEDDGRSFNYRKGEWMGLEMAWNDRRHTLTLNLSPGSRMLISWPRKMRLKLGDSFRDIAFEGRESEIRL